MNTNKTHITIVLDRSGSIEPIADDTIGGFNGFLEDQQKIGDSTVTLVLFNDQREVAYSRVPVQGAPRLTRKTFAIGGSTALLDALGTTIAETGRELEALPEAERPGKVLFVVLTDGLENCSRSYSRTAVFDLISLRRQLGWEFVFLGANQDAIAEAGQLGIDANAALTFHASGAGAKAAFGSASFYAQQYWQCGGPAPTFTKKDRRAQKQLEREKRKQRPSQH